MSLKCLCKHTCQDVVCSLPLKVYRSINMTCPTRKPENNRAKYYVCWAAHIIYHFNSRSFTGLAALLSQLPLSHLLSTLHQRYVPNCILLLQYLSAVHVYVYDARVVLSQIAHSCLQEVMTFGFSPSFSTSNLLKLDCKQFITHYPCRGHNINA